MPKKNDIPALVAIIPRKKDWEILIKEHWYRIPLKSAPQILPKARYIAFYQTKTFGEQKYAVNYFALIKKLEVVRRIDLLPDEINHERAYNKYYKITIDEIQELPKPIPSLRWRRLTFIPTTLLRLMTASEINDLWCTSYIEDKLYLALKKDNIPTERQYYVYDTDQPYCLDLAIFCKDGKLDIECDGTKYHSDPKTISKDRQRNNDLTAEGWSILRFSGKEINQNLKSCLKQIKKTIKRLNGLNS